MDKMNLKSKMKTMYAVIKSVCDYKNGDMYLTEIIGVYKSKKTAEKIKVLYQEKDGVSDDTIFDNNGHVCFYNVEKTKVEV